MQADSPFVFDLMNCKALPYLLHLCMCERVCVFSCFYYYYYCLFAAGFTSRSLSLSALFCCVFIIILMHLI